MVYRPVEGEPDPMGEPAVEWVPEEVDGVLWIQHLADRIEDADRPAGTEDEVKLHFPKTYTESLLGCRIGVCGRLYEVVGDPVGYMPGLTPGKWNRAVIARRVDG